MNQIDASDLLAKMKILASEAKQTPLQLDLQNSSSASDFSSIFNKAINSVNDLQQDAGNLVQRFESNDSSVNITQVMVALQKANLSFQAMTQVRNHVVSAYKDIMNMTI